MPTRALRLVTKPCNCSMRRAAIDQHRTGTEDTVGDDDTADQIGGSCGLVVANDAHPGRVKTLHEAITRHCRSGRRWVVGDHVRDGAEHSSAYVNNTGGDDTEDDADERRIRRGAGRRPAQATALCVRIMTFCGGGTCVGNCLHATQLAVPSGRWFDRGVSCYTPR